MFSLKLKWVTDVKSSHIHLKLIVARFVLPFKKLLEPADRQPLKTYS